MFRPFWVGSPYCATDPWPCWVTNRHGYQRRLAKGHVVVVAAMPGPLADGKGESETLGKTCDGRGLLIPTQLQAV